VSETALWAWLVGVLPKGQYNRIESPDTAPGFPDVHYQIKATRFSGKVSGTIELKDARFPQRKPPFKGEHDGLHFTQIHWMRENYHAGGLCWIVARVQPKVFWIPAQHAARFNGCLDLRSIATHVLDGTLVRAKDVKRINEMMRGEDR